MVDYTWDGRSQRYRDKDTGRFVKDSTVVDLVKGNITTKQKSLQDNLTQLLTGKKDLITYQVESLETIKTLHTQQYLVAKGGFRNTKPQDYLAIGRDLKNTHYPAFKAFVDDLQSGKLTEAQARQRLDGFAKASRQSYHLGKKSSAVDNGLPFARRFLSLTAEHCLDCPFYAGLGVVPADSVILPGEQCQCRYNCLCVVRFYATLEEAERG